jgi:hypothetical protein
MLYEIAGRGRLFSMRALLRPPALESAASALAAQLKPYVVRLDERRITIEEVNNVYNGQFKERVLEVAESANRAGSGVDVSFIVTSTFLVNRHHLASIVNALSKIADDNSASVGRIPA